MLQVNFYTKKNCPLCEDAKQLLYLLKDEFAFELNEIDIYTDDALLEKYQLMIPVVHVAGQDIDYGQINYDYIREEFIELNKSK
ncbi:glutaredoxin family protein [Aquibacillus saliphilus]|uniref:glutaredoxin family protein n=1 Tax=Aquibacillus saliphilus TaxID=1909422 RepID=UPI001CF0A1CF|nr:glutaredoxin family protein [Aquibacillus saliphilus]